MLAYGPSQSPQEPLHVKSDTCPSQRRGCRCKHRGKCKYACKCKKRCACKYWRGGCPSHEYFRRALAVATEENAGAAFMEHVEHCMRALRRAQYLKMFN